MTVVSKCCWFVLFALLAVAVRPAWAQPEDAAWLQQLHQSYADAGRAVAQLHAAATTPAQRELAWRRALQWQDLYRRHAEVQRLLKETEGMPALADERLLYQARVEMSAGRHAEATRTLEPLRRRFVRLPDGGLRQELRLTLAALDLHLGQPEESTRELNRVVDSAVQAGQLELAARAYSLLGDVQLEMFDYATGLNYHKQALRLAPDWAVQTRERARMGMAQMINMVGDRREAFVLLDTALAAFHGSQNLREEADALLLRGFFLHRDGRAAEALAPYRQALALREQLGGDADIINVLTHLCSTLSDARQLTEALPLCDRATRMADATDSQALRWDAYWVSAEAHAAAGNYKLAYEHQQQATRALQKQSKLALINLTGAMRERFDAERQRLENERLSSQLSGEQGEHEELRRLAYGLGGLVALLALGLAGIVLRRRGSSGSAPTVSPSA